MKVRCVRRSVAIAIGAFLVVGGVAVSHAKEESFDELVKRLRSDGDREGADDLAARRADDADELLLGDREADRSDRVGGVLALPVRLAQL